MGNFFQNSQNYDILLSLYSSSTQLCEMEKICASVEKDMEPIWIMMPRFDSNRMNKFINLLDHY